MSSDAVSQIKSSTRLSQYVANLGATLKPNGAGKFRTACCIHGGDNPTGMSIDDNLGLWYCYTSDCGGGSIIDLYMKMHESTDFGAAIEGLAAELGVQLPERQSSRPSKTRVHDALLAVSEAATDFLLADPDEDARAARRYLKSRGVGKRIINSWQLGMLPSGAYAIDFILDACDDKQALIEGGVLTQNPQGDLWVNMNGRLLFPILDGNGKMVAFGARIVPEVDHSMSGKYVNTSETSAYSKSTILYGMDLIEKHTENIILVEGYFDTIAVNESLTDKGVTVAVAACGTSVTESHAEYLSKFKSVTMVFDGDTAGSKAAVKSMWVSNKLGDRVSVVRLDSGDDPWDLYLAQSDRLLYLQREALPLMSVVVQAQWKLLDESERDLTDWIRSVVPNLTYSRHRDHIITDAARIIGQNVSTYKRQLALPISIHTKRGQESLDALSPHTKVLCRSIINMSPDQMDGILAGLRPWTSLIESAVRNWLPASNAIDVSVIKRLALGLDSDTGSNVDHMIAALMSEDDADDDLCVILRGISKQLLAGISSLPGASPSMVMQIKSIRRSLEACRSRKLQPTILAYLIDTAVDFERISAKASRSETVAYTA